MKTALAFVCSLLLLWTQFVSMQAAGASVVSSARGCCCGSGSSCCSADTPTPESQPVSAAPVLTFQSQLVAMISTLPAWQLPRVEPSLPIVSSEQFQSASSPVYARNCIWLI